MIKYKDVKNKCAEGRFFSYDDWFIGSTNVSRGVPSEIKKLTRNFDYNNIESLKNEINKNQILIGKKVKKKFLHSSQCLLILLLKH